MKFYYQNEIFLLFYTQISAMYNLILLHILYTTLRNKETQSKFFILFCLFANNKEYNVSIIQMDNKNILFPSRIASTTNFPL